MGQRPIETRCFHLERTSKITAIRIADDFLVHPASAAIASPNRSPNQSTGDRPPRNEYTPEMPDIGPRLPRFCPNRQTRIAVAGHHWSASMISASRRTRRGNNDGLAAAETGRHQLFGLPSRLQTARRRNGTRPRSEGASTRYSSCRRVRPRAPCQCHRDSKRFFRRLPKSCRPS